METQTKLFCILILIMSFSLLTSIWRSHTIEAMVNFLKIFFAYILILKLVNSPKKLNLIIWAMVLSGAFIGISSIFSFSGEGRLRGLHSGMFLNANDLALCFVLLLPFSFYLVQKSKNFLEKLFLLGTLPLFTYGIFLTSSRGAFVGGSLMLLAVIARSKKKIRTIIFVLAIIPILLVSMPHEFKDRISTIFTSAKTDVNVISRLDSWKAGYSMMTHRLFGVGLGNYQEGYVIYQPEITVIHREFRLAAHNSYMQIGGETGYIGFFVFLALIVNTFKSLSKTKKSLLRSKIDKKESIIALIDATYLSLVGFSTCALFLSQAYNWFLYYLIAFSVILKRLYFKDKLNASWEQK